MYSDSDSDDNDQDNFEYVKENDNFMNLLNQVDYDEAVLLE